MEQAQKNKVFLINYFTDFATDVPKTRQFLEKYMTDEALISHIEFFEAAFPRYKVHVDEMTAEGSRVNVRARITGTHLGALGSIPPSGKKVDFPFVICYEIENNMIISHWMIADQLALMEQIGVVPASEAAH
ncbi:MAG: ester cyclase [Ferruginibacter sp.]